MFINIKIKYELYIVGHTIKIFFQYKNQNFLSEIFLKIILGVGIICLT